MQKSVILLVMTCMGVSFLATAQHDGVSKGTHNLKAQLAEIEYFLRFRDSLNTEVSKADVAWHLDHSLKVINQISVAINNSDPEMRKSNFNIARLVVFTTGSIPRGRATAPESVRPPQQILTEDLLTQLTKSKKSIFSMDALGKKSNYKHPVFGQLNRRQTIKLLNIHTRHHLKIVKDILDD